MAENKLSSILVLWTTTKFVYQGQLLKKKQRTRCVCFDEGQNTDFLATMKFF